MNKKRIYYLVASLAHAMWMVVLTFLLLNWHFVHWDEGEILQFGPIIKKYVFGWEEKPAKDEFMFVNVSYDNQLLEIIDEWGFPIGNEPITDRVKLAKFIGVVAENNNHKALVCDIRFDLSSNQDSVLEHQFSRLQRYLVSNHFAGSNPETPVIDIRTGISDYAFSGGSFFKFSYILKDSIKTVPLLLNEITEKDKFIKEHGILKNEEHSFFNTFIVDFLIRPYDLLEAEENYFYDNLGNLIFLDAEGLAEITKDRIIVIGDFERSDIHGTLLGDIPGPLILVNAYLNLRDETNRITIPYVLFIFLSFFLISLYLVVPEDLLEKKIAKTVNSSALAGFITNVLGYFIMLLLVLSISYFFFGILLNLLWVALYLMVVDRGLKYFYNRLNR